jgi:signal transduction histidine kinase
MKCYPIQLERLLDNILNNATNAIPANGGSLCVKTYEKSGWACVEITNTGEISEEDRLRLLEGTSRGRGAYITHRIIRLLKGKLDVRSENKTTTVVVKFHIHGE